MNLDECWKIKPLMNGKDLIRLLELDRGPEVGVYMQEQVKWVLTNPEGTIEVLHGHLKSFKTTRELENDGVDLEPVSKKMHLEEN
jgi:tRNA nucleotidyltransferase (CCA-adding enzyme)